MNKTQLIGSMILIGLAVLAVLAACGGAQDPDEESPVPAGTPAGPTGEELVQERCSSGCHDFETVASASKDDQEWDATVERMRLIGAELTDAEAHTVVNYLAEKYGP